MRKLRILIDQDGVLYDLYQPWYALHNKEYGHIHTLTKDVVTGWDIEQVCKDHNCPADMRKYYANKNIWSDGGVIEYSQDIIEVWDGMYDMAVLTVAVHPVSYAPKHIWLNEHYPQIDQIIMVNASIKPWVMADFLIDDGIHNHNGFQGISILFNQTWNQTNTTLPRAKDWIHVAQIVARGDKYIRYAEKKYGTVPYKKIQHILHQEIKNGDL